MRFFSLKWFGQITPSGRLTNVLKYFSFQFQICRDIRLFVHSAYSQYTHRYVLCILSIRTDSSCIIPVCKQIHSVNNAQRNSIQRFASFSVQEQIHSAYAIAQYTNILIPLILSLCTDSFCVIGESAQIISNIQKGIIFVTAFKGTLLKKIACICATGPKTQKE